MVCSHLTHCPARFRDSYFFPSVWLRTVTLDDSLVDAVDKSLHPRSEFQSAAMERAKGTSVQRFASPQTPQKHSTNDSLWTYNTFGTWNFQENRIDEFILRLCIVRSNINTYMVGSYGVSCVICYAAVHTVDRRIYILRALACAEQLQHSHYHHQYAA